LCASIKRKKNSLFNWIREGEEKKKHISPASDYRLFELTFESEIINVVKRRKKSLKTESKLKFPVW
jgi:hypothetical protein